MATKLSAGWERTQRIKLPDSTTKLDTTNPLGAAITGSLIRIAQNSTDMEDVGNLLHLSSGVDISDGSKTKPVKIGTEETYEVSDGTNTQMISDTNAFNTMIGSGWKLVKVHKQDIMG